MFIENLKSIVITLVTVLIFISAVELISPNNKMKK
jgi:stage III sporulation protein AF